VNLPFIAAGKDGPKHLVRTIERSEFERMVADLVDRTFGPVRQALADARVGVSDLHDVLLVGGMTRMPYVRRRVEEFLGRPASAKINPDEVVAIGAALQGAALQGTIDEVLLLDVTPLSLGVETGGGVFTCLIPRNTTVPVRRKEIFTTSLDNQPFVPVHVLQGEREMAADNSTLTRFELVGIPPAPRGIPQIEVSFEIDADGILSVTALDLGTSRRHAVRVVASSGLSKDEVDRLLRQAETHRESDARRRERAEARNAADALLYTTRKALSEFRDLLPMEDLDAVEADVRALEALLETASAEELRAGTKRLESSAYRIAEALYAREPAPDAPATDADGDDPAKAKADS
jgi:molecular chaperone DnaK